MRDMIDYFLKMITPPTEDAEVLVAKPSEIDYERHRALESASLVPLYIPTYHGVILLEEPTAEEADKLFQILKPGAHVVLIPESIGYKGVIAMEDKGFEVRDAIYVAEEGSGFFYGSKAGRSEREAGLDKFEEKEGGVLNGTKDQDMLTGSGNVRDNKRKNIHPTVKPIDVMEWCARDIGSHKLVVDPFLGSGTTGCAMARLGHDFVGIELQPEYAKICEARIRYWSPIGTEIKSEAQLEEKGEKEHTGQVSLF